jgi:hypothetical protein
MKSHRITARVAERTLLGSSLLALAILLIGLLLTGPAHAGSMPRSDREAVRLII